MDLPMSMSTSLVLGGEHKEKQMLPIQPVYPEIKPDVMSHLINQPAGEHGVKLGADSYLVQNCEWTDEQLMDAWHMSVPDKRAGRCTNCGGVVAGMTITVCPVCSSDDMLDEQKTRVRKGNVSLPLPTLPVAPFHFRNVRHAMPDMPTPSQIQGMNARAEYIQHRRIEAAINLKQQELLSQIQESAAQPAKKRGRYEL